MIRLDVGNELHELLACAGQLGRRSCLDVATPFFDTDSKLWRSLVAAATAGSRVRLVTRPATSALEANHFTYLNALGVRLAFLPTLHAKAILLSDRKGPCSRGWIGSHNFTKASESTAHELGVAFGGRGTTEARLLQQALIQIDCWDRQGTKKSA